MGKKIDIAFKGAAVIGALTSIPRVRHWIGDLMVKANENLGIPQNRTDIDLDTPDTTTTTDETVV